MLARLAYSHAARELRERLVSEVSTYSDVYGRGAFLTEEASATVVEAEALLDAAVVADRTRGASWQAVAEALDVPAEQARDRFAARERDFHAAVLFPHRFPEDGALGYTAAPYAVAEADRVRQQLDAWVVEHRPSSGPDRDEPLPVTRGLLAMSVTWISETIGLVLELSDALINRDLPAGVSYEAAQLRHAQLKVDLYEAMLAQRPGDREVELQLIEAREQLSEPNGTRPRRPWTVAAAIVRPGSSERCLSPNSKLVPMTRTRQRSVQSGLPIFATRRVRRRLSRRAAFRLSLASSRPERRSLSQDSGAQPAAR